MDQSNLNEVEIPPKKIFELMKSNVYDNYFNYSWTSINKDYISSRKSLFNILHKITIKMGFKSQTFFLSAHYLDIIFTKKRRINANLNTLGLASLCLSAKFCENDPIVPHLQYFIRIFNNINGYKTIISMSDLKRTEVLVLKLLNYKLNYYTIYDFNSFLFGHGILKIDQLKDIESKSRRLYRSRRREFSINPSNSLLIKNILEKIYKKSRYYLEDIIHNTKLCFKYNPLFLAIFIMKKSVEEIMGIEQKINNLEQKEQDEFYSKTSLYFKQIMFDFYKIDYEKNEQYKDILIDDEILEIFKGKEKNEEPPAPSADKKIQKEEDKKIKANNLDLELEENLNINNEIDNKSKFTNTYSRGFYNRIKIKANLDELNKRKNEKNIISSNSSRKEYPNINSNNDFNSNKDEDDIDTILNINQLKNEKWNNKNSMLSNSKKGDKEETLSNNNVIKNRYIISSNNRYIQRTDLFNTLRSSNTINKNYNNFDLTYSAISNRGSKIGLNQNIEPKTEKNSPIKISGTNVRNNYSNYMKLNKYIKTKTINTENNRNGYSYNLNDISNNSNSNFNYNTIKKYEKKPYFRKLVHTNANDNQNSIKRNGISSYYYYSNNFNSEVNRNKINNNNETNSLNRNQIDVNNKEIITSKINTFYNRIKLKKKNKEDNIIENENDEFKNKNNINYKKQEVTTTSSRYRRRFYHYINNQNNNDISTEIKNRNPIIMKESNKREIESYSQSNSNTMNSSIFNKIPINNIFRRKNKILNININNNSIDTNEKKEDNKGLTGENFYKYNTNRINVNTKRENINNESYESSKRISYLLAKKNSELNNTLKEINKTKAKNNEKEISLNILNNDDTKKVYQSIRHKYLNLNKNKNKNNESAEDFDLNNNRTNTISDFNKKENNSTINIKNGNNNLNLDIKYSFRNKNASNLNNKIENNNINISNNSKNVSTRISKAEDNNKNKVEESSIYRIINKTKAFFKRNTIKEEELNIKKIDKNINNNDKNNFFKSQQNFYKPKNKIENNSKINSQKEEKETPQNSKLNNVSYLRSIINKNRLSKENKENPNSQTQKNSSTIVINNNININIGNKTNNINNEYVKYKNVYKPNNMQKLNINSDLLNSNNNNSDNSIINTNRSIQNNNNNTNNIGNSGNTFGNLFHRFHFHRKNIDNNNNITNNNSITDSNINNNEKNFQFFHRK